MKKFLNGISRALCVMSFCVFAGCSYANNSPGPIPGQTGILEIKAGFKPDDVFGEQTMPIFSSPSVDHIFISESCAGLKGYLIASDDEDASTCEGYSGSTDIVKYQWYSGTTGNWQLLTGETSGRIQITIVPGTTYYICEALSEDGNSKTYSNVCTIQCGIEGVTDNIGKIAYSDGTYSLEYDSNKNPIGVIYDVYPNGNPKLILNFNYAISESWSHSEIAYDKNFITDVTTPISYIDGSKTWQVICDNIDAKELHLFYAFVFCNNLTDGDKNWYLPARDELVTLYYNKPAVEAAFKTLKDGGFLDSLLEMEGWYCSSSQYSTLNYCSWGVDFTDGDYFLLNKKKWAGVFAISHF